MIIVAERKNSICLLYFLGLIGGCLLSLIGYQKAETLIGGILVIIISLIILIHFANSPKIAVQQDEKGNFFLYDEIILASDEIIDVRYRRVSARGLQYKWGKLMFYTKKGDYTFSYIKDVEYSCKYILEHALLANKNSK